MSERHADPAWRERVSTGVKLAWKDPEKRGRMVDGMRRMHRQNSGIRPRRLPMGVTVEQHAADLELLARVKREWGLA